MGGHLAIILFGLTVVVLPFLTGRAGGPAWLLLGGALGWAMQAVLTWPALSELAMLVFAGRGDTGAPVHPALAPAGHLLSAAAVEAVMGLCVIVVAARGVVAMFWALQAGLVLIQAPGFAIRAAGGDPDLALRLAQPAGIVGNAGLVIASLAAVAIFALILRATVRRVFS